MGKEEEEEEGGSREGKGEVSGSALGVIVAGEEEGGAARQGGREREVFAPLRTFATLR